MSDQPKQPAPPLDPVSLREQMTRAFEDALAAVTPRRDFGAWFPPVAVTNLRDQMSHAFQQAMGSWAPRRDFGAWFPPVEVCETSQSVRVTAELPGMSLAELEVSLKGNVLTVSGEKRPAADEEAGTPHLNERVYGKFSRAVTLPAEVDPDQVEATYERGVLTVVGAKAKTAQARKISIKA